MPKKSFDDLVPLAERGDWSAYLAAVEKVSPMNGRDDAYHHYALAVALEATAYKAKDVATTTRILHDAVRHNDEAIRLAPSEVMFREAFNPMYRAFASPGNPPHVWVSADDAFGACHPERSEGSPSHVRWSIVLAMGIPRRLRGSG